MKIWDSPSHSPSVPNWKTDRWDGDACGGEDNVQSDSHGALVSVYISVHKENRMELCSKGAFIPLNFLVHAGACMRITLRQPPCLEFSDRDGLAPCLHKQCHFPNQLLCKCGKSSRFLLPEALLHVRLRVHVFTRVCASNSCFWMELASSVFDWEAISNWTDVPINHC